MNVEISSGVIRKRQKVVIYGTEGVGKSTLASHFPKPLFIDTEGSTANLNINRFKEPPSSWEMIQNYVEFVKHNPQVCETLVIDTFDWAERLCVQDICAQHDKKGIEDFGYGNGYIYVYEAVGRFLNALQELIDNDICHVVLNCHAHIKKFEQPDESGSYDRYELKLGKKTSSQTAPLVKEWADMILFCNYETFAVATDKDGKKFKGQGGQRVMYTTHHPCWDAKNRAGLAPKLPLDYSSIAHVIEGNTPNTVPSPAPDNTPEITSTETLTDMSGFEDISPAPVSDSPAIVIPSDIPKALQDLMRINNVSEEDIRAAIANRGYYPESMPISKYDIDFINGILIGAWDQVYAKIKELKKFPF